MSNIKGIIFDMDNTILRSNIDFDALKAETYDYLMQKGVLPADFPVDDHTSSSMMIYAQQSNQWDQNMQNEIWEIFTKHELRGMEDADLEPGAMELLHRLHHQYKMAVFTNNSYSAALTALQRNNVDVLFDAILGREQVRYLKPHPDGVHTILNMFPTISADEWISVGDAWVDGKASQDANVTFISYQGDLDKMHQMGVFPAASIQEIDQLLSFL